MSEVAAPLARTGDPGFAAWMHATQQQVEAALDRWLPSAESTPERLHEALRYAVLGGGKRVRPLLTIAAGELTSAPAARVERVAVAIEFIHAYSLVHDDLPCMDDDVLRRGRPTCHVRFDEATAMLAGDALQSEAIRVMVDDALADDPARNAELLRMFALACGSRGMAGGQAIDLASTGRRLSLAELEHMHSLKTGALIRAAVLLGAGCGTPLDHRQEAALTRFAEIAGLAFQVVDDILDVEASSSQLGKTAGKDAAQNKPTYVSILGLAAAKAKAAALHAEAHAALSVLGSRARRLSGIADFIILRTN